MMQATRKSRAQGSGFTLIEVVMAVGLALGLMGSMLWLYQHTAEVRDTLTTRMDQINSQRQIMDRISEQLRGALALRFLSIGIEGQTDRITFVTAQLPGPAAWAVRQSVDDPIPPQQDLQLTSFGLSIDEDENGNEYIAGIDTTTQRVIAATTAEEGDEIQAVLLADHLLFVRFRYWDGQEWLDTWQDSKLPQAVEIALGKTPLPDNTEPLDYPHELKTRVVHLAGWIPSNDPAQSIPGGLGGLGGLGGAAP